jgi:predicted transcriptional regulator
MKLTTVRDILNAEVIACENLLENEVFSACGSDLMSDVLAFVKDQGLLLTGLNNPQVVRTSEMMDIKCIVFVRGKQPDPSVIELAKTKDMVIMKTKYALYTACGLLFGGGLKGGENETCPM